MSYNPTRVGTQIRKTRRQDPKAGIKHSEIMRRNGVGTHIPAKSDRKTTKHGISSEVFSCSKFVQNYVLMYAGNNTGIGVNKKGDRTVRVFSGVLYVTFLEDKVCRIQEYFAGHYVKLPKGTKYSLATSGTGDIELLVTETTNYEKGWEELEEEGLVSNTESKTLLMPSQENVTVRRPRSESKAKMQAQKLSGKKDVTAQNSRNRKNSVDNVNSSSVIGVNPRPSGPPTED